MTQITFDEWKKLEMKVGKIVKVERVPKTEKLYKLQVDVGGEKEENKCVLLTVEKDIEAGTIIT